jgi:Flp pilus assembly pilin Flp
MTTKPTTPQPLWPDEQGGTHIEYALLAGFASALILGGLLALRDGLSTFYTDLAGLLAGVL